MAVLVLAIDTATAAVTAGVASIDAATSPSGEIDNVINVVSARVTHDPRRHGEALAPQIRACLAESGVTPHDLAAIVVGAGPGPFTGLRVGMVTAAAFADSVGCPVYAVCSLDAVASAVLADLDSRVPDGPLLVATDARRKEIYWACYSRDGTRLAGPAVDKPAAVKTLLHETKELTPTWAVGPGALLYQDVLELPIPVIAEPTVAGLVDRALSRILAAAPSEPVRPLYLRRPDVTLSGRA